MIETTKLATLANVLSTTSAVEISRKELITTAAASGLGEKDCYFVLKPAAKGSKRGMYDLQAMLNIANTALAKRNDFTGTVEVSNTTSEKPLQKNVTELEEENGESEASDGEFTYFAPADDEDEEIYEFQAIEPSDEDIADELSLMGTL